jgi:site-specific recombinase XerD
MDRFIGPDAVKVTVRELADEYKNDYRVNGKKSLDKASRSVNQLLEFFGDYRAHLIGADTVKKYVSMRLEAKAANATINRELAALKRMFNLGIQAEKIDRKSHIAMLQEDNVRRGFSNTLSSLH